MTEGLLYRIAWLPLALSLAAVPSWSCTNGNTGEPDTRATQDVGAKADAAVCVSKCQTGGCGQDGCGGYCPPCDVPLVDSDPGDCLPHVTLCNEDTRQCQAPPATCSEGWCFIPAGSFIMSSLRGAPGHPLGYYRKEHPVVLTRAFWMQQTEVTQGQWLDVMDTDVNPSPYAACGMDCPVSGITLYDMIEYANRMSQRGGLEVCYDMMGCNDVSGVEHGRFCDSGAFLGPDCTGFRLPAEAEWELAAGAAADTAFTTGFCDLNPTWGYNPDSAVANLAWFGGNSEVVYSGCMESGIEGPDGQLEDKCLGPHPVGLKAPNRFGLLDILGNVEEATGSVYAISEVFSLQIDPGLDLLLPSAELEPDDPDDPDGHCVVSKGGFFAAWDVSLAHSEYSPFCWWPKNLAYGYTGFRLARTDTEKGH